MTKHIKSVETSRNHQETICKKAQNYEISTIEKKNIFILRDSMVKQIYRWEINQKINNKHKVFVRCFSGAKATWMRDCTKLCPKENNPEHIVLHVGTNDLPSEKPVDSIALGLLSP